MCSAHFARTRAAKDRHEVMAQKPLDLGPHGLLPCHSQEQDVSLSLVCWHFPLFPSQHRHRVLHHFQDYTLHHRCRLAYP